MADPKTTPATPAPTAPAAPAAPAPGADDAAKTAARNEIKGIVKEAMTEVYDEMFGTRGDDGGKEEKPGLFGSLFGDLFKTQ
jgi:hypothetical protein